MQRDSRSERSARQAADHLAFALEEAGFDVGLEFPHLQDVPNSRGATVVRVGDIDAEVAGRLADALMNGRKGTPAGDE